MIFSPQTPKVAEPGHPISRSDNECAIVFVTSAGITVRATFLGATRYRASFQFYDPTVVLQTSDVLTGFDIVFEKRLFYSGRAVVSSIVSTDTAFICEATLDDAWRDVDFSSDWHGQGKLSLGLDSFLKSTRKHFQVRDDFKLVVADLQILLTDLQHWLRQVELGVRSQPAGDRNQFERQALDEIQQEVLPVLRMAFERFEDVCCGIDRDRQAAHALYVKRQLHPLVLCAPFMYRSYHKPLGYAGDYEMVNMMVRDSYEGGSVFAKVLNSFFLQAAPVQAHRNRLGYLQEMLISEAARVLRAGRALRLFNIGCGPAIEIQKFLAQSELSHNAAFTLMDFNDETLEHTAGSMREVNDRFHRLARATLVKKSVAQFLRDYSKPASSIGNRPFDLVYCAGLFDYLPDHVCQRLINVSLLLLAPGGLLVCTNVDEGNPSRNWMEYCVDWHLIYRNSRKMSALLPAEVATSAVIKADLTGVNVILEVRKSGHV